jgi:hypothetical protein
MFYLLPYVPQDFCIFFVLAKCLEELIGRLECRLVLYHLFPRIRHALQDHVEVGEKHFGLLSG